MENTATVLNPEKVKVRTFNTIFMRLVNDINQGDIIIGNDNAGNDWSDVDRSKFIESALLRLPMSLVYVTTDYDGKWHVMDGRQRLATLESFIKGNLALNGLLYFPDLNGLHYNELPNWAKRRVRETDVTLVIIECGTPDEVVSDIVSRVKG